MRTKTVYPIEEVCHLFANGVKREIRNQTSSVFTSEDKIFSYGYHFPMAKRLPVKTGGFLFLFNPDSYSNTTSKHQGCVRRAIGVQPIICLPRGLWNECQIGRSGAIVREYFQKEINNYVSENHNKRFGATRRERALTAIELLLAEYTTLHELCKFRVRKPLLVPTLADLTEVLASQKASSERLIAKREAKYRAAQKERELLIGSVEVRLEQWKNGENVSKEFFPMAAFMRVKGGNIETTQNSRVGVPEVIRFIEQDFPRLTAITDYNIKCGPFQGACKTEKELIIGCHHFPLAEVNRIIKELVS